MSKEILKEEALAVKIIANDLLDNLENYNSDKEKIDYLANVLCATSFMIHRQFGADIAILQLDMLKEHIAKDYKNNSLCSIKS